MARRPRPERTGEGLPLLPGFREMGERQQLLTDLVRARQAAGLSQAEVAARMGTSQPAIARFEAGSVDIRLSTLQRYVAAINHRLEIRVESSGGTHET